MGVHEILCTNVYTLNIKAHNVMTLSFRLLDILEVIAPYKHFHKLRQFVDLKLPPGFPVKLGKGIHTYIHTCIKWYCKMAPKIAFTSRFIREKDYVCVDFGMP